MARNASHQPSRGGDQAHLDDVRPRSSAPAAAEASAGVTATAPSTVATPTAQSAAMTRPTSTEPALLRQIITGLPVGCGAAPATLNV